MRLAIPMIPSRFELHHSTRPPFSHIRPAAHRPLSAPAGPILGYSESVSPWNVYLNHCHYHYQRRSIYTHSLSDTPDSVPRTLTHSLTRLSQPTDHFLDDLPLLCWSTSSSLLAPTRPGTTPGSDRPPSLISGLRYRGLVPPPTKADLSNLATSPWHKQADRPWRTLLPCTTIRGDHSFFRPSTSTWTTSCPIHQTAALATALFFMR